MKMQMINWTEIDKPYAVSPVISDKATFAVQRLEPALVLVKRNSASQTTHRDLTCLVMRKERPCLAL